MPSHFRHLPRLAVSLHAQLAHPMAGWQRDVEVVDLGVAGAQISYAEAIDISEGERVTIAFQAPNLWDPLTLTARVAWVKPENGRAGIAFEHKSPPSAHALLDLITALELG